MISLPLAGCVTGVNPTATVTPSTSENTDKFNTITDMRGVQVKVPKDVKRVAVISDGFVEEMMISLGVQDTIVATGFSDNMVDYSWTFPSVDGSNFTYSNGENVMFYLDPAINNTIRVNPVMYNVISYENLANANPDVVIVRIGDCAVGWDTKDTMNKTLDTMESLGIPIIVLYSPSYYSNSDLSTMRDEIRIIGEVFGKEDQALELADYLQSTQKLISDRTKDIPEANKPTVLYLGLSPLARKAGGSGDVWGVDTPESYTITNIANAKNAYPGTGSAAMKSLNTEQILALDPDVILLATDWGYHPTRELYEAPYYQDLSSLKAVKNQKVYALPWTPSNCARRLEYPIDLMITAKACYPDRFQDINVYNWSLDFYKNVYGVDNETAKGLASAQWLDWMNETGF